MDPFNVGRMRPSDSVNWSQVMQTATKNMDTIEPEGIELMDQNISEIFNAEDASFD